MSVLSTAVNIVVRAASAVRGERIIHAKGHAHNGRLTLLPAARELDVPLTRHRDVYDVVLRFSRGAGLPDLLPDVLGLAVRIPDADGAGGVQDLMLTTGAGGGWARRFLVPRRDYLGSTCTSLIAYDVGGRDLVLAALPVDGGFELATAEGSGPWTPFARLVVGSRLPEDQGQSLGFEITHDAGGFRIGGRWRTARAGAYRAARSAES